MKVKKKPAPGAIGETGLGDASTCANRTAPSSHLKRIIVRLAVWGAIPASLATWLIGRGGMRDA